MERQSVIVIVAQLPGSSLQSGDVTTVTRSTASLWRSLGWVRYLDDPRYKRAVMPRYQTAVGGPYR